MNYSEALDTGNFHDGSVCVDCLMIVANGDHPDDYDSDQSGNWPLIRKHTLAANLRRFDVTLGHLHRGEYAHGGCFHAGTDCADDCDCDRADYATSPCALCGSPLAGARHDVVMVDRAVL